MAIPKVLLFDLGGVLVDGAGLRELAPMLASPMAPEELRRKWVTSPAVALFETGRCSGPRVCCRLQRGMGARHRARRLPGAVRGWVGAPYPETAELLSMLGKRHALACLSNTNAVHWESLRRMDGLKPVLERPFLSHELGLMKPSREVFAQVARELGCEPGEIAFFDDGPENVDGAAKAGLSAHQAVGPVALRNLLRELGLL